MSNEGGIYDQALAGPEGTSKLHEEVAHMPMVSTISSAPSCTSQGVPYNQLTE